MFIWLPINSLRSTISFFFFFLINVAFEFSLYCTHIHINFYGSKIFWGEFSSWVLFSFRPDFLSLIQCFICPFLQNSVFVETRPFCLLFFTLFLPECVYMQISLVPGVGDFLIWSLSFLPPYYGVEEWWLAFCLFDGHAFCTLRTYRAYGAGQAIAGGV